MEGSNPGYCDRREFAYRIAATAALAVGLLAVWHLSDFVFLSFGAVLFAVLLNAPSRWLATRLRIPYKLCLAFVTLVFFGALGGAGWLFAPRISSQFNELATNLPEAAKRISDRLQQYGWVQSLMEHAPKPGEVMTGVRGTISKVGGVFLSTVDAVTGILFVVFVGIFLAVSPQTYVRGILHLLPMQQRDDARGILERIGDKLRYWLLGQSCAMAIIGIATWAGLALLDVRLAVALGLLAGLLEFIPTFGPIIAAIPAILIALMDSPQKALYVALLYVAIQFAENHLLVPLVQRRAVNLPPALSLLAILLFATVFGFLGLLFAIPMTAALFVLVQETYVKRTLNDPLN
jgi:predicted PurR-regulated permease PerM